MVRQPHVRPTRSCRRVWCVATPRRRATLPNSARAQAVCVRAMLLRQRRRCAVRVPASVTWQSLVTARRSSVRPMLKRFVENAVAGAAADCVVLCRAPERCVARKLVRAMWQRRAMALPIRVRATRSSRRRRDVGKSPVRANWTCFVRAVRQRVRRKRTSRRAKCVEQPHRACCATRQRPALVPTPLVRQIAPLLRVRRATMEIDGMLLVGLMAQL